MLKSPGSREISGLCLPGLEEQPELPWLPTSGHSLTASSNRGLPLQIAVRPGSYRPVPVANPHWFLEPMVSSRPRPVRSSESVFVVPARYGRIVGAGTVWIAGL